MASKSASSWSKHFTIHKPFLALIGFHTLIQPTLEKYHLCLWSVRKSRKVNSFSRLFLSIKMLLIFVNFIHFWARYSLQRVSVADHFQQGGLKRGAKRGHQSSQTLEQQTQNKDLQWLFLSVLFYLQFQKHCARRGLGLLKGRHVSSKSSSRVQDMWIAGMNYRE